MKKKVTHVWYDPKLNTVYLIPHYQQKYAIYFEINFGTSVYLGPL